VENNFKYTKKVLYFGMPDMGSICLARMVQEGVNIVGVVAPPPDAPTFFQFCNLAKVLNLNLITYRNSLKDADFIEKIKSLNADVAIVCSYSKLFPEELLNTMPNRFVNVHPSVLPKYRGPNPYSHVIINEEEKTGITLHLMDKTFDTGDLLVTREITIEPKETMGSLFNKINYLSGELIIDFLKRFETHDELKGEPQPKGIFPTASEINVAKGENVIDWSLPAKRIERFVRGLNPFISALTYFRGLHIKVYGVRVLDKKINAPAGTILNVEKGLFVNTGDGIIEIRVVQAGTFFIGEGRDFVRQMDIKKGEMFTNE